MPGLQTAPALKLRFGAFLFDFIVFMAIALPIGLATMFAQGEGTLDVRSSAPGEETLELQSYVAPTSLNLILGEILVGPLLGRAGEPVGLYAGQVAPGPAGPDGSVDRSAESG